MLPLFNECGGAGEGQRAIANYRGRGSALPAHKCGGARGVVNLLPVLCGAVPLRELCLGLNARRAGWGDIMPIPYSRLFLFERIEFCCLVLIIHRHFPFDGCSHGHLEEPSSNKALDLYNML